MAQDQAARSSGLSLQDARPSWASVSPSVTFLSATAQPCTHPGGDAADARESRALPHAASGPEPPTARPLRAAEAARRGPFLAQ